MAIKKIQTALGNVLWGKVSAKVERVQSELGDNQRVVVSRFARGNASIQAGRFLTKEDLERERNEREEFYREKSA